MAKLTKEELGKLWESLGLDDADIYEFGSEQLAGKLYLLNEFQLNVFGGFVLQRYTTRVNDAQPLLWGISTSIQLISKLMSEDELNFLNEVYILARGLVERIITFYYLQCCSDGVLEKFNEYGLQKNYRKATEEIEIQTKSKIVKVRKKPLILPEKEREWLESLVSKYTGKKGNPITRWDTTTIDTKFNLIKESEIIDTGILELALKSIYDKASEILHGTQYGATFQYNKSLNHSADEAGHNQFRKETREEFINIYFLMALLLNQLISFLAGQKEDSDTVIAMKNTENYLTSIMAHSESIGSDSIDLR